MATAVSESGCSQRFTCVAQSRPRTVRRCPASGNFHIDRTVAPYSRVLGTSPRIDSYDSESQPPGLSTFRAERVGRVSVRRRRNNAVRRPGDRSEGPRLRYHEQVLRWRIRSHLGQTSRRPPREGGRREKTHRDSRDIHRSHDKIGCASSDRKRIRRLAPPHSINWQLDHDNQI